MEISQDNLEIFFDNDNPFLTKLTEDKMVGMEGELTLPGCLIVVLVCSQYLEFLFLYHYSHITLFVVFPNRIQICLFPYFYMMNMKVLPLIITFIVSHNNWIILQLNVIHGEVQTVRDLV
jgi:hypothetical protein